MSFKLLSTGASNLSTCLSELGDAIFNTVVTQVGPVRTEGVGLDAVDTRFEVGIVNSFDDVGTTDVENLVATLELLEIIQAGIVVLQHGAHGAISNHNALRECVH